MSVKKFFYEESRDSAKTIPDVSQMPDLRISHNLVTPFEVLKTHYNEYFYL